MPPGKKAGRSAPRDADRTAGHDPVPEGGSAAPRSPVLKERQTIIELLQKENGHVASVAEQMKIPVSTLYRKLKQYELRAKDYKKW